MRALISSVLPALLVCCIAADTAAQPDRITGRAFATRSEVLAKNGMVATSVPLATQVGVDILQAGGSAVDAAIAANAALGLMEPTGNGIGGDIFAIVWDAKTKKLHGLNGSGRSPLGLSYDGMKAELAKLNRETIPPHGMLPISVPGCVDGWFELHKKFGKLPMKQVLQPAINYANEGFPVSDIVAYYMDRSVPISGSSPARFSRRSRSTAARPREARSSRTRRSRKHCRSSPNAAATPSTKANSPIRWTSSLRRMAASSARSISKNTPRRGTSRSR
jgi:gamma-glutamyltranspeptidase/glutathione hydrolase